MPDANAARNFQDMRTLAIDAHTITEVVAIDGPAGAGKSTVAHLLGALLEAAGQSNLTVVMDPSIDPIPDDQVEDRIDSLVAKPLTITLREEQLARSSAGTTVRSRP